MANCFLFPGQGAQYPGMGQDLFDDAGIVRDFFKLASEITGRDCANLVFNSTEEDLKETENTQIAVSLINMSTALMLEDRGITSSACAGFSLGEIAALWNAGVLTIEATIAVAAKRGRIMAAASQAHGSDTPGMAAVLGLDLEDAKPVLEELNDQGVYLANHSSPTQIVIAGTAKGLDKADELFEKAGAMRYIRLKVSGPFHSPMMESARIEFAEYLGSVEFSDPSKPFISNSTGTIPRSGEEAKQNCIDQIVSPVRWVATEELLLGIGFDTYLETGPGKVLSGLWKSFHKKQKCLPIGTLEAIELLSDEAENEA